MSSDVSKCVNFSVLLDITGVLKDSPSQKHQKCIYSIICEWKMVLVVVDGVPMSSDMAKRSFFTGTDIMSGMCGLSVPAIHICKPNIITYYIYFFFFTGIMEMIY